MKNLNPGDDADNHAVLCFLLWFSAAAFVAGVLFDDLSWMVHATDTQTHWLIVCPGLLGFHLLFLCVKGSVCLLYLPDV